MDVMRSWLFVPAHDERKVNKAPGLGSDVVVLDLEDGVPADRKDDARRRTVAALSERPSTPYYFVRVNAVHSGYLADDLAAMVPLHPDGLVLPKVERPEDVLLVDGALGKRERQAGFEPGEIPVLVIIESARGLVNAAAICASCARVMGLLFGGEDFALDIGLSLARAGGPDEMVYARSALVVAAAAEHAQAVDRVYTDVRSRNGLRRDTQQARRLGFSGKAVIHPDQVAVVNELFRPTPEEVTYARRVLAVFEQAESEGHGAVSLDGHLVDRPIVERARQVLQAHQALEERGT